MQPVKYLGHQYSYDNNGNLTSKVDKVTSATTTYQYDGEDKLTQVATPTDIVLYQYDGFGRRISKSVNGVVTKYVYDREDVLFEFDENDQIKARYTHGPGIDEPISVDRDTDSNGTLETTYYYQYDGLGSVIAITDSLGNVVQSYVYDTFGRIVQQAGSIENSYTYTGREWDTEAGLYYYRARYYNPTLGRFINGDPIGFAGGDVNFYVYVQNNPVNFIDPSGEYFTTAIGIFQGGLSGFFAGAQNGNLLAGVAGGFAGAAAGALVGTFLPGSSGLVGSFVGGLVGGAVGGGVEAHLKPCGDVLKGALLGAAKGGLSGLAGGGAARATAAVTSRGTAAVVSANANFLTGLGFTAAESN